MTDESFDVRPSRAKRRAVSIGALVLILGTIVFVVMLLRAKKPNAACDHIEELAKSNPREAEILVDAITGYLGTHLMKVNLVNGKATTMNYTEGDTPDERCRNAMQTLENGLAASEYSQILDCLSHVKTATEARTKCLVEH